MIFQFLFIKIKNIDFFFWRLIPCGGGGRVRGRKHFTFNDLMLDQGKILFLIGPSPLNKLPEQRMTGLQTKDRSSKQNISNPMSGHIYYSQTNFRKESSASIDPFHCVLQF